MSEELEKYVERIVEQTDCSKSEREDLFEEMLIHLSISRDEEIDKGKSEKEASQMAMKSFGKEAELGDQLQQAMFPYRKELLMLLSILGFAFTVGQYLYVMMADQAALLYVLTGLIGHSAVLFFALNQVFPVNRKLWLGLALLLNLLLLLWNGIVMSLAIHTHFMVLMGYVLMLLLNIYLLYRTVLTYQVNSRHKKARRTIHTVNITLGLLTALPTAYMYFMFLGFGGPARMLFYFFGPVVGWIILYIVQVFLVRRYPKIAVGSLVLSFLLLSIIWSPWLISLLELGF